MAATLRLYTVAVVAGMAMAAALPPPGTSDEDWVYWNDDTGAEQRWLAARDDDSDDDDDKRPKTSTRASATPTAAPTSIAADSAASATHTATHAHHPQIPTARPVRDAATATPERAQSASEETKEHVIIAVGAIRTPPRPAPRRAPR